MRRKVGRPAVLLALALLLWGVPALAAPPEVVPDPVVEAALEGDYGGIHYEIDFFGTKGVDSPTPNAAVEVRAYDSSGKQLGICNFGEETLDTPSSLLMDRGLLTASFTGSVPFDDCLGLGDATFDLEWAGTGKLSTYVTHSCESDSACHPVHKSRAAIATGTVEFSSVPSFNVTADNSSAYISLIMTRFLNPGAPPAL